MSKQDIQFQIDQLRKDKIIYAVEATATSATALVAIFLFFIFDSPNIKLVFMASATIAIGFWIFVMLGNFLRLKKIIKLEQTLPNN